MHNSRTKVSSEHRTNYANTINSGPAKALGDFAHLMRICSRSQSSFHIMLPTIMEPAALCTCGVLGGPLALITSSVSARHRVLLSLPNWFAFAGTLSSQPSLCQIFSASPLCLCLLLPRRPPTPHPLAPLCCDKRHCRRSIPDIVAKSYILFPHFCGKFNLVFNIPVALIRCPQ